MALNLGAEVALALHTTSSLTYGAIESAVIDAGFENYTIMRNLNFDGSADVQLFVRSPQNSDGSMASLPAAETLTKLSQALTTLQDGQDDGDNVTPDNAGGDTPAPAPAPEQPDQPAEGDNTDNA